MRHIFRLTFIIPLVLIVLLGILGVGLFKDQLLKYWVVSSMTSAAGARVDLREATVSFIPLTITLSGLEVGDKDRPMQNLFESESISFSLDVSALLRKKLMIDRMAVEGLVLATPRETSASLASVSDTSSSLSKSGGTSVSTSASTAESSSFLSAIGDQIDVTHILPRSSLRVQEEADAITSDYQRKREFWTTRLQGDAYKAEITAIQDEYERVKKESESSDYLKKISALSKLPKVVKSYQRLEKKVKRDIEALQEDIQTLKTRVDRLDDAAQNDQADARRLLEKDYYSGERIASVFLGKDISQRLSDALGMFRRVKAFRQSILPSSERSELPRDREGTTVEFASLQPKPLPALWIKHIVISGEERKRDQRGIVLRGDVWNLSSDTRITKTPIRASIRANGPIVNMGIYSDGSTRVGIKSGIYTGHFDMSIMKNRLKSQLKIAMTPRRFLSENVHQASVGGVVLSAMKSLDALRLTIRLNGSIDDPDIAIKSNMDKALQHAFSDSVNEAIDRAMVDVTKELKGITGGLQRQLTSEIDQLADLEPLFE